MMFTAQNFFVFETFENRRKTGRVEFVGGEHV